MRIISGTHKGRIIDPPRNLRARPTTDFAKENIFNILANRVDFEGLRVLDLFAGIGSVSYEFASRGAESVVSVEINAVHHAFIRTTAAKFGFAQIHPVKANAFLYLRSCSGPFDVIFADPPYDIKGTGELPAMILDAGILAEGGILVFEHSDKQDFSDMQGFTEQRNYGSVNFSLFTR